MKRIARSRMARAKHETMVEERRSTEMDKRCGREYEEERIKLE